MKNVIFFITHKTLNMEHAELSLGSIAMQQTTKQFDTLYIYNSHSNELSNTLLIELCDRLNIGRVVKEIIIYDYDPTTNKSLGADVYNIKHFMLNNFNRNDRVLLLKSDTLLSKNFFEQALSIAPEDLTYFVAPFICAKKRVPNEEIVKYSQRDNFIASDEITFFVEDENQSQQNDFHTRPEVDVTDQSIEFTSCYVIRDFSCHYINVGLLERISISDQSWGGVKFDRLVPFFKKTDKCFTIHKYHDIISVNRNTDREGPVAVWLNS